MIDTQQTPISQQSPVKSEKTNFNNLVEEYISNVKKDGMKFNSYFGKFSEPDLCKTSPSRDTPTKPAVNTNWNQIFKAVIAQNIKKKISQFEIEPHKEEKHNVKDLMALYLTKQPTMTKLQHYSKQFEFSHSNAQAIQYNHRDLEDIYIDYAYNRKKRMILQDMLNIQPSSKESKFLRKITSLGKPNTARNKNILQRNIQTVRNGSERVRVVNSTLTDRQFSKNHLKMKLGNSNSKTVLMQKATKIAKETNSDFKFENQPTIPFYKVNNAQSFKKSWSVKQLTNSNIIHNSDANFYHAIKEKIQHQQQRQKRNLNFGELPLFKSSTIVMNKEQAKQGNKNQKKHMNSIDKRKQDILKIKESFSDNYLTNALKNVKQDFFKSNASHTLSKQVSSEQLMM